MYVCWCVFSLIFRLVWVRRPCSLHSASCGACWRSRRVDPALIRYPSGALLVVCLCVFVLVRQVNRVLMDDGRATGVLATVTPRGGGKVKLATCFPSCILLCSISSSSVVDSHQLDRILLQSFCSNAVKGDPRPRTLFMEHRSSSSASSSLVLLL